jgi:hypothetical protein
MKSKKLKRGFKKKTIRGNNKTKQTKKRNPRNFSKKIKGGQGKIKGKIKDKIIKQTLQYAKETAESASQYLRKIIGYSGEAIASSPGIKNAIGYVSLIGFLAFTDTECNVEQLGNVVVEGTEVAANKKLNRSVVKALGQAFDMLKSGQKDFGAFGTSVFKWCEANTQFVLNSVLRYFESIFTAAGELTPQETIALALCICAFIYSIYAIRTTYEERKMREKARSEGRAIAAAKEEVDPQTQAHAEALERGRAWANAEDEYKAEAEAWAKVVAQAEGEGEAALERLREAASRHAPIGSAAASWYNQTIKRNDALTKAREEANARLEAATRERAEAEARAEARRRDPDRKLSHSRIYIKKNPDWDPHRTVEESKRMAELLDRLKKPLRIGPGWRLWPHVNTKPTSSSRIRIPSEPTHQWPLAWNDLPIPTLYPAPPTCSELISSNEIIQDVMDFNSKTPVFKAIFIYVDEKKEKKLGVLYQKYYSTEEFEKLLTSPHDFFPNTFFYVLLTADLPDDFDEKTFLNESSELQTASKWITHTLENLGEDNKTFTLNCCEADLLTNNNYTFTYSKKEEITQISESDEGNQVIAQILDEDEAVSQAANKLEGDIIYESIIINQSFTIEVTPQIKNLFLAIEGELSSRRNTAILPVNISFPGTRVAVPLVTFQTSPGV